MIRSHLLWLMVVALLIPATATAQPQTGPPRTVAGPTTNREIFIPFEDLKAILASGTERIFMTRQEYTDLLKKANLKPGTLPPQNTTLTGASYHVQVHDDHAVVTGKLQVESLAPGVQLLALPLTGVSIQRVAIGDKSTALVRRPNQPIQLVLEQPGVHQVDLQLELPVQHSAAQQSLGFQLPNTAATSITMTVPGNIELKSGASVLNRRVDEQANLTHFELLPVGGSVQLVMSLNNKRLQADRVIQARNVVVAELAEAFERIHVSTSVKVLHGAIDSLQFQVPDGFEITDVKTKLLARWLVSEEEMKRVLKVELTETTTKDQLVNITAIRVSPTYEDWTFPAVKPLGVISSSSVIGILTELTLTVHSVEPNGLLALDNAVLDNALPRSIYTPEPGAPAIRLVNTYYAAQADYTLDAEVIQPENRFTALSNLLFTIEPTRQHLQASFTLQPEVDDVYTARISLASNWQVLSVIDQNNKPVRYHITTTDEGQRFIQARLNTKIVAGETGTIHVQATHTPTGWLNQWEQFATTFPPFVLEGAYRDIGMLAVRTAPGYEEVFRIRAGQLNGLTAVSNSQKTKFGLGDVRTQLAYRYEQPQYEAALTVHRIKPIYAARCASFFHILPGKVHCNYEVTFEMQRGRTDQLVFSLPDSTPSDVLITGIGNTRVKRFEASEEDGQRLWHVTLTDMAIDDVILSVRFVLPGSEKESRVTLPGIQARNVSYQTGVISLECSAELQITPITEASRVDVGELAAASYAVGRRRVGAYGYVGTPPPVAIQITEPGKFSLPRIIVNQCNVTSFVSKTAKVQNLAELFLDARTDYVVVELPKGSQLWTVTVENQPVRPQRTGQADGNRFLVDLSKLTAKPMADEHGKPIADLAIVYESNHSIGHGARLKLLAPRLYRFERQANKDPVASHRIPVARTNWRVVVPNSQGLVGIGQPYQKQANHYYMTEVGGWLKPRHELPLAMFLAGGGIRQNFGARMSTDSVAMTQEAMGGFSNAESGAEAPDFDLSLEGADFADEEAEMLEEKSVSNQRRPSKSKEQADTPQPPAPASKPTPKIDEAKTGSSEGSDPGQADQSEQSLDDNDEKIATVTLDQSWANLGKRSLQIQLNDNIEFEEAHEVYEFNNLSEDAEITGIIVHKSRVTVTGWSIGLLVFALGLLLCGRSSTLQIRFVAGVEILMMALYFFNPLPTLEDAWIVIAALTAALVPIYMFTTVYREWIGHVARRFCRKTVTPLLMAIICLSQHVLTAQEGDNELVAVKVPAGSVIVPYDPEKLPGERPDQQLLVPLDYYTQLWRRAFPDKPLPHEVAPVSYAIAGAHYETSLVDGEFILLQGYLDIDLFATGEVTVPLGLTGGVLQNASVDGKSASLEIRNLPIPAVQIEQQPLQQRIVPQQAANAPTQKVLQVPQMLLHLSGKGRHRLEVTIRVNLVQQGGWRIADIRLPAGPATEVLFRVPRKNTEIRWQGIRGKSEFTTSQDAESVVSAAAADGRLQFRWRSGVTQTRVDRDLTANSSVMVDVQEDGTYVDWDATFQFRSAQRDLFRLLVPTDYRVENVLGNNVRSWQVREVNGQQEISVELLEAATQKVQLKVRLVKYENIISGEVSAIRIPRVVVPDSVLHQGTVVVRRSPILNLRPSLTNGIVREDVPQSARAIAAESQGRVGPLGLEPVQAYRFSSTGFDLEVEASLIPSRSTARLQNVLRVSQQDITLETRVQYSTTGRAVHQARVLVPSDMVIRSVHAPALVDWSEVPYDHGGKQVKLVTVLFSTGVTGTFNVVIDGHLERKLADMSSSVPHLSALDVTTQSGDTVLLTDPSYSIDLLDLENGESVPVFAMNRWLRANQRQYARAAFRFKNDTYSANFKVTRRNPTVRVSTYSNVKLTPRAIEETLLLDYSIKNSGIRQIQFQLPGWLRNARIRSQYLRDALVVDSPDNEGWLDVTLELEDEVIGQLQVIIEHDRELQSQQRIPIPVIKTGIVEKQFVALESTGDEIRIDEDLQGLEKVERHQAEWSQLSKMLPGNLYAGYKVDSDPAQAVLVYSPVRRAVMDKDNAKILLAETTFFMDRHGTYRTKVVLHVDNQKEQFLAVQLPNGAVLWSVLVADAPVKPLVDEENRTDCLRIPLIRTELGDNAFTIQLIYAGNLPSLDKWTSVKDFPFLMTPGNVPTRNHITVNLPRTFHWSPNTGGTLDRVDSDFQQREAEAIWEQRNRSLYSKVQQSNNVNDKIRLQFNFWRQRQENKTAVDEGQYEEIQQELDEYFKQTDTIEDNRKLLNDGFDQQSNSISRNAVNQLGNNFDIPQAIPNPMKDASNLRIQNSQQWLRGNGLEQRVDEDGKKYNFKSRVQKTNKGKSNINSRKKLPVPMTDNDKPQDQRQLDLLLRSQGRRNTDRGKQQAAQYLEQQQLLNRVPQTPGRQAEVDAARGRPLSGVVGGKPFPPGNRPGETSSGQQPGDALPPGFGGIGGGGAGRVVMGGSELGTEVHGMAVDVGATSQGLVSLAVELGLQATDYDTFYFSAPGDELELEMSGTEQSFRTKLQLVGVGLAIVLGLIILYLLIVKLNKLRWFVMPAGLVLALIGLASMVYGFLPIYAAILFAAGLMWTYSGFARRPISAKA